MSTSFTARTNTIRLAMARRGSTRGGRRRNRGRGRGRAILLVAAGIVLVLLGYGAFQYVSLATGIKRSDILGGTGSADGATNILVMGLDSRVDENGSPLPKDIYEALHAGDQSSGGLNANVLMLLHIPGDGSRATEISIPRDDYVDLPGCPDGQCKGKIKQAYGLSFDQESKRLSSNTTLDRTQREQQERDAGRKAEIAAVKQFLGGLPVDHFVEVTMVAFYQLAQVVQPITVCLAEDTQDRYSGADFHQGVQQIDSAQSLAFVRQRRDEHHPQLNFTDLDRERRQQAFIASLATQLKQAGTLADPAKLSGILNVAKQNMAIDNGLDLLSLADQASQIAGGNVTFYTLPIDHFGKDTLGEDVNVVNVQQIQVTVAQLLGEAAPVAPTTSNPPAPSTVEASTTTVDLVNTTGRSGLSRELQRGLIRMGYRTGASTTGAHQSAVTTILYTPGQDQAARRLAAVLGGLPTRQSSALPAGTLRIVLEPDFNLPAALTQRSPGTDPAITTPHPATAAPAVPITSDGAAPPPSAMSALAGGGVPCVK